MKVYTIEVADAIEREFTSFLKDWGGGCNMRFVRFVDLGGKQTDLYVYPPDPNAAPWMVIRIKSVFKTDQGECMQYFLTVPTLKKQIDDVIVSPEVWKIPALADKLLKFVKNDLLMKAAEGAGSLPEPEEEDRSSSRSSSSSDDDEENLDDMDLSSILASGDSPSSGDFNPEDILASFGAEAEGGGEKESESGSGDFNPEDLLKSLEEESDDDDGESGFNPEDVIKD